MSKYYDINRLDEILALDGEIVTVEKLEEIIELDIVKWFENNGNSGRLIGYKWYSIKLYSPTSDFEEEEISVYVE